MSNYEPLRVPGLVVENKTGMQIPTGPTAEREPIPAEGTFRANTSLGGVEIFINGTWVFYSGRQLVMQSTINADTALSVQSRYPVNTSNNSVQVTLPRDPKPGDEVSVFDYGQTWDIQPVRVTPGPGDRLDGTSDARVYYDRGGSVSYVYIDNQRGWVTMSKGTGTATQGISRWVVINTQGDYTLEPGIGYAIDTASIAAPVELKLPAVLPIGKEIVIADISGKSGRFPITAVTANRINGIVGNYSLRADWGMLSLLSLTDNNWQVITDTTITRSQTAHVYTAVTANNTQLVQGNWYPLDCRNGPLTVILPNLPTIGDVVRFYDLYGMSDTNRITIKQAASGETINQRNESLVIESNFASVEMVFTGPGPAEGWRVSNSYNFGMYSSVVAAPSDPAITPDFTRDSKTMTVLVNRNLVINKPLLPKSGLTSFFIILDVDAVGGYNVTLPGMPDGWFPAVGSAPVRADANLSNVIQGIATNGRVYYTNTIHKRA